MKKHSKSKLSAVPKVDPYLEGLVGKLLERFAGLEKKMDAVIAQTTGKSSGNGDQSRPFQSPEVKQPPRRERTLYEAICADCHKVCEVPFKPSEARPVYCKPCFAKRKAGGSGPAFPVLTPVLMPPKPISKLSAGASLPTSRTSATSPARKTPKKTKKKK